MQLRRMRFASWWYGLVCQRCPVVWKVGWLRINQHPNIQLNCRHRRSCHNLNSTQFQTTATTLLIIFLQSCKYSITKPSLNPPCSVHNAHVFVRHILIQNLLVAVQCLDMKCSAPLSECKIWFVPTGIEPSNFLSMPWLSSQHAAWPLLPTQDFSNVLNESVCSKPKWITPEWFHFICFFLHHYNPQLSLLSPSPHHLHYLSINSPELSSISSTGPETPPPS